MIDESDDLERQAAQWRRNRILQDADAQREAEKLFAKLERVDAYWAGGEIWEMTGWYDDGRKEQLGHVVGVADARKLEAVHKARDVMVVFHGRRPDDL